MAMKPSILISSLAIKSSNTHLNIALKLGLTYLARNYCSIPKPTISDHDRLPKRSTPWLMLHPEVKQNNTVIDRFFSPAKNQVVRLNREKSLGVSNLAKCIASTRGWLGFVEPKGGCPVNLTNPFRVKDVVQLPSLATMHGILDVERDPKTGNVEWFKKLDSYVNPEELVEQGAISNLSLSSCDPRHESFVVASQRMDPTDTCINYYPIENLQASKMLKEPDKFGWKLCEHDPGVRMDFLKQVTFSGVKNLFYAVQGFDIYILDLLHDRKIKRSLKFVEKVKSEARKASSYDTEPYIVALENGDILYILRRYKEDYKKGKGVDYEKRESKTLSFDIFKVDFNNNKLERIETLGDRTLFIGSNDSFSVGSTSSNNGLQANSVYFIEHERNLFASDHERVYHNGDVHIFNMVNNVVSPCYQEDQDFAVLSPYTNELLWVAPQL